MNTMNEIYVRENWRKMRKKRQENREISWKKSIMNWIYREEYV